MQQLFNTFASVGDAIKLLQSAITSVVELVGYVPVVIGSAIIVFLSVYVLRFCLLK